MIVLGWVIPKQKIEIMKNEKHMWVCSLINSLYNIMGIIIAVRIIWTPIILIIKSSGRHAFHHKICGNCRTKLKWMGQRNVWFCGGPYLVNHTHFPSSYGIKQFFLIVGLFVFGWTWIFMQKKETYIDMRVEQWPPPHMPCFVFEILLHKTNPTSHPQN